MSQEIVISVDIAGTATEKPLGVELWLDDKIVHDINASPDTETYLIKLNGDDKSDHELKFVLKNKTPAHTQIDDAGNIVNDATVTINNLKFDGIKIGYDVNKLATYTHDFNGHSEASSHEFFDTIGCNGTVSLKFSTPIYLWLLEHM